MEQLNNAIGIDSQQQQQQQQQTTNAIVSDSSSLTDNGIKGNRVTDPQAIDDFEPNQKWEITTLEKASYDCSDMYMDSLTNQNSNYEHQPDTQKLEQTELQRQDKEVEGQTQDEECLRQIQEQAEQPQAPEPKEESIEENPSSNVDTPTTIQDQQQAGLAFNSDILSQASVDAQMEKVIDNIVELGGCQPYTHNPDQPESMIDKDKEVEHIQREIVGDHGLPTKGNIQGTTTIPVHKEVPANQEENFDCEKPSLPDDSQQLPDLKLTNDIVPDHEMLTNNLEVKDLIRSDKEEAKKETGIEHELEAEQDVEFKKEVETEQEDESMPTTESEQEVNIDQGTKNTENVEELKVEAREQSDVGQVAGSKDEVGVLEEVKAMDELSEPEQKVEDTPDDEHKMKDTPKDSEPVVEPKDQEKTLVEESSDKQPEDEKDQGGRVEEEKTKIEESMEETRPARSTRSRAVKRSSPDDVKKAIPEKRQSKRTRVLVDDAKEKEQIEKTAPPPAAKTSTVRTLNSRHTISTSAPSTHSEPRSRSSAITTRNDSGAMYSCENCKYSTNRLNNIVHHKKIACDFIKKMFEAEVTQFKKTLQSPKGNKKRR